MLVFSFSGFRLLVECGPISEVWRPEAILLGGGSDPPSSERPRFPCPRAWCHSRLAGDASPRRPRGRAGWPRDPSSRKPKRARLLAVASRGARPSPSARLPRTRGGPRPRPAIPCPRVTTAVMRTSLWMLVPPPRPWRSSPSRTTPRASPGPITCDGCSRGWTRPSARFRRWRWTPSFKRARARRRRKGGPASRAGCTRALSRGACGSRTSTKARKSKSSTPSSTPRRARRQTISTPRRTSVAPTIAPTITPFRRTSGIVPCWAWTCFAWRRARTS